MQQQLYQDAADMRARWSAKLDPPERQGALVLHILLLQSRLRGANVGDCAGDLQVLSLHLV